MTAFTPIRRRVATALAVALAAAVAAPSSAVVTSRKTTRTTKARPTTTVAATTTARPVAPEKLTIAVDGFTLGTPVWVGLDKGHFKDQNLDVKTATFQTGLDGIRALSSGQVDFAFGLDFAVVSSTSPNLAIVGTVASPLPGFHRLTLRQEVSGSRGLFNKKMGVIAGTSQDYVTQRWLELNSLSGNVELVPLPSAFELLAGLKTNQIQGAFLFGAALNEIEKDANLKVIGDDSEVLATQGIYLLTTAKLAREKPQVVKNVLLSFDKATKAVAANPPEAADITAKAVKGDAAALLPSIRSSRAAVAFSPVQRDVLLGIQKYLLGLGRIPAGTDVTKSFVLDPLREAIPGRVGF
jgi:NitT/TauT family transport system substrate-binding protein